MSSEREIWHRANIETPDEIELETQPAYICPALADGESERSKLIAFNPWSVSGKGTGKEPRSPYLQLQELVRQVPADISLCHSNFQFSDDFKKKVCEWCGKYGLLGLLPHNVHSLRIESWQVDRVRWRPQHEELSAKPVDSLFKGSYYPYQAEDDEYGYGDLSPSEIVVEDFGLDARAGDVEEDWWPYFPHIIARGSAALKLIVPPDRRSSSLYEDVPKESPGGTFWNDYREPLLHFAVRAKHFAEAVDVLENPKCPIDVGHGQLLDHRGALERLNQLASVVIQQVRITDNGEYVQRLESPSLLGHLASAAAQKLLLGSTVRECPGCGSTFTATDKRTEFCGKSCRDRNRQRRHRARLKNSA